MENQNQIQGQNQGSRNIQFLSVAIIIASILISGSILYSSSKKEGTMVNNNNQPTNNQPTPSDPVKVSVDDDPVLGDKNAPLTMIEFSDYECPFCKRHFTDVYPQIKKDYIDTGKVKLVYRDFIAVPSHNPLATSEAMAAQCAKDQGGDLMYFKYHDAIFTKTISNGNGLAVSELPVIAKNLGLNVSAFQSCLDSNKYKDEVAKDITDGQQVGVNGTPSFFIGKSNSSGTIDGTIIVGAQPFSAFKVIIDEMLK